MTTETIPDRETIIRRWDTWQKRIAADKDVSWARHEFELLLDGYEEEFEKLRAELDEAGEIMKDFLACMCADDAGGVMTEIIVPTGSLKQARAFLSKHQRAE